MRNSMFHSGRRGRDDEDFGRGRDRRNHHGDVRGGRLGQRGGEDRLAMLGAILEARAMFGGRDRFGSGFGGGKGRGGDFGPFGDGPGGRFGGGRGGPGGSGRGGERGGRRKRLFDQAELQTLLLALIVEQPRHGYDLIREIEALSGGDYAPSPGVVYPALTYMEDAGLIAPVANEGARKAFEATEQGRAKAAEDAGKAAALKERLGALAAQRDRVDPAPVRRAIHALRTAMFDRLSQEGADRALILEVADAIDEATRKIERIER